MKKLLESLRTTLLLAAQEESRDRMQPMVVDAYEFVQGLIASCADYDQMQQDLTAKDQAIDAKDQEISKLQADVNLAIDALRESGNGSLWAVREITGEDAATQTTTDLPALAERILRVM